MKKGPWTEKESKKLKRLFAKYCVRAEFTDDEIRDICSDTTERKYTRIWTTIA